MLSEYEDAKGNEIDDERSDKRDCHGGFFGNRESLMQQYRQADGDDRA